MASEASFKAAQRRANVLKRRVRRARASRSEASSDDEEDLAVVGEEGDTVASRMP